MIGFRASAEMLRLRALLRTKVRADSTILDPIFGLRSCPEELPIKDDAEEGLGGGDEMSYL